MTEKNKPFRWKEEFNQILLDRYFTEGKDKIAEELGCSAYHVVSRAQKLGLLKRGTPIRWTPEMEEELKRDYVEIGPVELAKRFGRTLPAVLWKAKEFGLKKNNMGRWTEEKLNILKERFPTEGGYKLAEELNIPIDTLWTKASKMGLHSSATERRTKTRIMGNDSCDIHYFETWTNSMAFVTGFLFADGSIAKEKNRVSVHIALKDQSVIHHIGKELKCKNNPYLLPGRFDKRTGKTNQEQISLVISSMYLVKTLADLGMHPRKTYNDDPFPNVPVEFLPHFIRGYLDGDGSTGIYGDKVKFGSVAFVGSPKFMAGLRENLIKYTGLSERKMSEQDNKKTPTSTVAWTSRSDLRKFYDYIYPEGFEFCLERKRQKLADWLSVSSSKEYLEKFASNQLS